MGKLKKYLVFQALLAGTFFMLQVQSQGRESWYTEKVYLHADRSYYLAGERILYTAYCRDVQSGQASGISQLLLVELLDASGRPVLQEKLKLDKGRGWGHLDIPDPIPSGKYFIRSYTNWMRNFGYHNYAYRELLIIDPEQPYLQADPASKSGSGNQVLPEKDELSSGRITLKGLKAKYAPREEAEFLLEAHASDGSSLKGDFSISLSLAGTCLIHSPLSSFHDRRTEAEMLRTEAPFLPDLKGLQLSGQVLERGTAEPVSNTLVLLSPVDTLADLYSTRTDEKGVFRFELYSIRGNMDVIIQTPEEEEAYLINLDPEFSDEPLPEFISNIPVSSDLSDLFRKMRLHKQLRESYGQSYPEPESGKVVSYPFYGRWNQEIDMEDYIRLPLMEEVFRELTNRVFLERSGGSFQVSLLDHISNRIIGDHPYYFLDGVPFWDPASLLELDPGQISRIRLINKKYFLKDLRMDGIIDIQSVHKDASLLSLPRSAIRHFLVTGQNPGSMSPEKCLPPKESHLPYFRSTLLFIPHWPIQPDEQDPVRFTTPDGEGSYDLVIKGFNERGEAMEIHRLIQVENKR